jgi:beta-lactamase regulating signal transducer with metallopeptidase domain
MRNKAKMIGICTASHLVMLYLFSAIRLFLPLEFSWTKPISMPFINPFYHGLRMDINLGNLFQIKGYILLAIVVIVVALIKMALFLIKYYSSCKFISRFSYKVNENWESMDCDNSARNVQIRICHAIRSPISFGIINKMIILPDKDYDPETRELIIKHELGHHINKDLLVKILVEVFCIIYWWNPIAYLLKKELNQTFELRCDQVVISDLDSEGKIRYLQVLLEEYKDEQKQEISVVAGLLGGELSDIEERFRAIRDYKKGRRHWAESLLSLLFVISFLLSYTFVFQSRYLAPENQLQTIYGDEFSSDNSTLLEYNGKYYIHLNHDLYEVEEEYVNKLIDDGFTIRKGERN